MMTNVELLLLLLLIIKICYYLYKRQYVMTPFAAASARHENISPQLWRRAACDLLESGTMPYFITAFNVAKMVR